MGVGERNIAVFHFCTFLAFASLSFGALMGDFGCCFLYFFQLSRCPFGVPLDGFGRFIPIAPLCFRRFTERFGTFSSVPKGGWMSVPPPPWSLRAVI